MKRFAAHFPQLDQTTKTSVKTAALAAYFRAAPEDDKLWTIALLSGRRPRRAITTTKLREWAAERAGIPLWLFEECYPVVGDLAETVALIWPTEAPEGAAYAVRLKTPLDGQTTIQDEVQSEVSVNNAEVDDYIILRADGTPTYMLAVVVDDHDMGVTHVIRGEDLFDSTKILVFLQLL